MIVEWINRRNNTNLTESDLVEVKNFALVWNIFEGHICNFTIEKIEEKLANIELVITDFRVYIDYFKDRYITGGEMNDRFENLQLRRSDRPHFVARTLLGTEISTRDCVLATTIIVYRFRNNLFHGLKEMHSIESQRNNFNNANQFLMKLIDKLEG